MNTPSCSGTLFVVATPIGNLDDFSPHGEAILRQVDCIACEDSRQSQKLLQHFSIQQKLLPLHQHNEAAQLSKVLNMLENGQNIALISDAGTPLISDPGQRLLEHAHARGIRVSPVVGACSVIAALSVSGFAVPPFYFAGFIPAKGRETFLKEHAQRPHACVFFEAPHRIEESLRDFIACFEGERELLIAREISKQFEEIRRLRLHELSTLLAEQVLTLKGEFVLVLGPYTGEVPKLPQLPAWQDLARHLRDNYRLSMRDASRLCSELSGENKNTIYHYLLQEADDENAEKPAHQHP